MTIAALWRYPVKSMAGELVQAARLTPDGLIGDRIVQVYDRRGRLATARSFPRLLRCHATLGRDGEPLVDGRPWRSAEVARLVEAAVEPGARLRRLEVPQRFDVLPLLVCTDGAVSRLDHDVRRLRPNVMIGGVGVMAERQWEGRRLRMPEAEVVLERLRARCVMTTYDPDTAEQDPGVLRDIVRRFGGRLCLDAAVGLAGRMEVGQTVELIQP